MAIDDPDNGGSDAGAWAEALLFPPWNTDSGQLLNKAMPDSPRVATTPHDARAQPFHDPAGEHTDSLTTAGSGVFMSFHAQEVPDV